MYTDAGSVTPDIVSNELHTADQILQSPISKTDLVLKQTTRDGSDAPGSRSLSCGYSSAVFDYLYRQQNKDLNLGLSPPIQTNLWAIHALVDCPDNPNEVTNIYWRYQESVRKSDSSSPDYKKYISYVKHVPEHQVAIVAIKDQKYLVDLTFCQFVDREGKVDFNGGEPLYPTYESPEVRTILQKNYLLLDENSLQQLLIHTTSSPDLQERYRSLDNNVLSKMLQNLPVFESDLTDEEIERVIPKSK